MVTVTLLKYRILYVLYNHHHNQNIEYFQQLKKFSCVLCHQSPPHSNPGQLWANNFLYSSLESISPALKWNSQYTPYITVKIVKQVNISGSTLKTDGKCKIVLVIINKAQIRQRKNQEL